MRTSTLRLALAVSLIVNLFAVGVAVGAAWMWTHPAAGARPRHGRAILSAGDALPVAEQQRFRSAMQQALEDGRPLQQTARESRRAAAAAFVDPTFDPRAVDADLARARDADFTLRTRLEGAVVDFARTLPPAERATLAEGLARGGPLRHPQRHP